MAGRYFGQEDPLLASQTGRAPTWTPEQLLQLAVLETAVRDLRVPSQRDRVLAWVDDPQEWGPTSFVAVCHSLDLDPEAIHAKMHTMTPERYYRRVGVHGDGRKLSTKRWFGGSIGRPSGRSTAVNPEAAGRPRPF